MNLRFIETFLWIVRLGSFSAAAEKLNATQASISNRIATLERELGVQLFDRESRNVTLTSIGRAAVPKAEEIIRAANEFREAIASPTTLKGTVSIGTIDSIVHSFLPHLFERVQERYPGIAIDLNVDTSLNVAREITDQKIDLALIMGPVQDPALINLELGTYRCVWVANPKYGLHGRRLSFEDLCGYPIFAFSKGSAPHHGLLKQFRDEGLDPPTISNSNSLATIMRLASDGLGIAPLPRVILDEHLASGKLVQLDVFPAFKPLTFHAVYPDHPDNLLPSIIAAMAAEVSLSMADV
ncbi:LysR family transcriptional regulator [Rhizobium sp. LC145]|jgi:DNA-binding transcriptional LysR family regulator|uniref:LysR family transcriptional regulator n=1 Tax=Rhizobium sp. LC145 TaxID=1120688 RepID=UPI000629E98F|nr:LysR family transcriptional regulator [Rhizobium sp. LC145]KKX33214.1 LysR family transcriptional regulator [Rhizobium sp. LC145]TKT68624.1 LysR family transcriptional regulator [Rhizobiaceae bacterium LC148]